MKRWTKDEIKKFDRLVDDQGSQNQVLRIAARLELRKFQDEHGKEKCDAMWAHLEAGGAKEDGPEVEVQQ